MLSVSITIKQVQSKPSIKSDETTHFMILSNRAWNYEAKATSFAFKAFFYEFLQILEDFSQKKQQKKKINLP